MTPETEAPKMIMYTGKDFEHLIKSINEETLQKISALLQQPKAVKSVTLQELFDSYEKRHILPHCRSGANMKRLYKSYLEVWGERQVSTISRIEISELFTELAKSIGKTTANRVIQFLRPLFNHGIDIGLIDCPNPVTRMKVFKLQPRERFLEKDEIARLFEAFDNLRYETTRDFLYMCLFTGARRSNVAAMRWDQISFERKMWHIPLTKNGSSQNLPLTELAMQILSRRREDKSGSLWVFPSARSMSGHLTKPEEAWRVALQKAELSNLRIHDLRRTLASWLAMSGANTLLIGQMLHHKDPSSTLIYGRTSNEALQQSMNLAVDVMTQSANTDLVIKPSANCRPNAHQKFELDKYSFGFGVDAHGKRVEIPDEVEIISKIIAMKTEGVSLNEIANTLNNECRYRRGRRWNKSGIDSLIQRNKKYRQLSDERKVINTGDQ